MPNHCQMANTFRIVHTSQPPAVWGLYARVHFKSNGDSEKISERGGSFGGRSAGRSGGRSAGRPARRPAGRSSAARVSSAAPKKNQM